MDRAVARRLERWRDAGVVDEATIGRIRQWETEHAEAEGSRLGRLAFGFGGFLLAAGLLLFVAANWQQLSPWGRFALFAVLVGALHLAAGAVHSQMPALATVLHAVGTAALGGGIFLAGQAFHLAERWPEGLLLWGLGAVCALWYLRDWPHVLYVALLLPAWLVAEWSARIGLEARGALAVAAVGSFVLAIAYVAAVGVDAQAKWRHELARVGAVAVVLAGWALPFSAFQNEPFFARGGVTMSTSWQVLGWSVAVLLPLAVGWALRGREAWPLGVALAFALVVSRLDVATTGTRLLVHCFYLAGAVGLTAWGLRDAHRLRINLGTFAFALTVLSFYFSSVFDKFGRSLGLIALGALFIGGGWLLERTRRRLLRRLDTPPGAGI
jgi:uncharacterized membrane protein